MFRGGNEEEEDTVFYICMC